jgi:HTH-type transcriptional regulator/antitoxin HigA
VLRYAIEELGHSQAEIAGNFGFTFARLGSLARRRPLTLEMIQKVNVNWKIPADLFVQPHRVVATAA